VTGRDDAAFRLATFLVTAARDVVDEPAIYGPFRMVDAVDRLMAGVFDDEFLSSLKPELERQKQQVMSDRDGFVAWLDELAARFAAEAKRRNLEATSATARARPPAVAEEGAVGDPEQASGAASGLGGASTTAHRPHDDGVS